ncbi:MAG: DUF1254 domain-containing protein [Rhizomicrobium sp.]
MSRNSVEPRSTGAAKAALLKLGEWSAEELGRRSMTRRAVQAVIWGIPVVNFDLMYQAMVRDAKGGPNRIVYWSRLFDWKNQTLTPNPDAIYFMPLFDTRNGPMVLEVPAAGEGSITGSVMDCWQAALEDVGTAGVDKGRGGRYVITPPGYDGPVPSGAIVLTSGNYQGYGLLRSILKGGTEADIAKAVAYGKQIRLYPLARPNPPETRYVDAIDVLFEANIPYDLRFFESLHRMIQAEPWLERDRAMIDVLRTLGIEKGRPFTPDGPTADILETALEEARAWFDLQYETRFTPHAPGARWFLPADPVLVEAVADGFAKTDVYPIDGRGLAYYYAFSSIRHIGAGQYYLFVTRDKDGDPLDGARRYRLTVPSDPPVRQYWSATAYDFATHALIRGTVHSSRSSQTIGLKTRPDGAVDVFFGPRPPPGEEANWVPTAAGVRFEVLFRFYGPDKPLFDKTWILPDIEKAS